MAVYTTILANYLFGLHSIQWFSYDLPETDSMSECKWCSITSKRQITLVSHMSNCSPSALIPAVFHSSLLLATSPTKTTAITSISSSYFSLLLSCVELGSLCAKEHSRTALRTVAVTGAAKHKRQQAESHFSLLVFFLLRLLANWSRLNALRYHQHLPI